MKLRREILLLEGMKVMVVVCRQTCMLVGKAQRVRAGERAGRSLASGDRVAVGTVPIILRQLAKWVSVAWVKRRPLALNVNSKDCRSANIWGSVDCLDADLSL